MISIFPRLVPSLQVKLAQLALLKHRAAVLAVLPSGKGRGTNWASQPAPDLLKAVVHFAGHVGTPKVSHLLLRVWFQKKAELRVAVRHALFAAGYPVPPLAEPEPRPYNVRLAPEDVELLGSQLFFSPGGQPVPNTGEASREETSLMAHLLGWSVLPPPADETPPEVPDLYLVASTYRSHLVFRSAVEILAKDALPPDLAAAVSRGELPAEAAPFWTEHWPVMLNSFREHRAAMQAALHEPVAEANSLLVFEEFDRLLTQLEKQATHTYCSHQHRLNALAVLARVEHLRHRQHADFAALATLRERTAAVRATFATEWPLDEATGLPAALLPAEQRRALLAQAFVYELLLRLVDYPDELVELDETTADFQLLEAAVPPAVLNALLLRKLEVIPATAPGAE